MNLKTELAVGSAHLRSWDKVTERKRTKICSQRADTSLGPVGGFQVDCGGHYKLKTQRLYPHIHTHTQLNAYPRVMKSFFILYKNH